MAQKWVANQRKSPSEGFIRYTLHREPGEYWAWRGTLEEGPPQPTEHFSAEDLTEMSIVGLYREVPEE